MAAFFVYIGRANSVIAKRRSDGTLSLFLDILPHSIGCYWANARFTDNVFIACATNTPCVSMISTVNTGSQRWF
jgi:hypothetical protein